MRKRKKRMENSGQSDTKENDFSAQITKITKGLSYISEVDAEISFFAGNKAEAVTAQNLLNQAGKPPDAPIQEKDFTEFFAGLVEIQDWFGEEETATAKKFADLKDLLEKNLKDIKVLKVGKIELDVYVVGLDAEGKLAGIQTKAVET